MQPHEKIIADTAKRILVPEGLFRKGSSRVWMEDHGFFVIQVEFQPSGFAKGTYLNVGISFLFDYAGDLNSTLAFNIGGRVLEFTEYQDDDTFRREMERYAEIAKEKVLEFRQFENVDYARKVLHDRVKRIDTSRFCWDMYELAMVNFLTGRFAEGKEMLEMTISALDNNYYWGCHNVKWLSEVYDLCTVECLPQCVNIESARAMVEKMVNRRRQFFMSKASFKKMNGLYSVSDL